METVTTNPTEPAGIDVAGLLTQLGVLLVPASVIALFCQIMDVSPRNTAALSLLTAMFAAICLYRRAINNYVPATIAVALVVALAAVFYFNYENILLKDTGLIRYYKHSNDFLADIDREILSAKHEMLFVGTNFNVTAGERRDSVLKRLGAGVSVKYLIFDPKSSDEQMSALARDFSQSTEELKAECQKGLESLLELRRQWQSQNAAQNSGSTLEIRVFNTHPHARFYFFDPDSGDGRSYYIPYAHDTNSPIAPGFLLRNIDGGVSQSYYVGVKKLWIRSAPLI